MLDKIYSSRPTAFKRHKEAPLFHERDGFLTLKYEQGALISSLKSWACHLLRFVSDFHLCESQRERISIDDIVHKADALQDNKSEDDTQLKTKRIYPPKEYYIIRAIDFLDYIGLLDERYYDHTLCKLVESKHSKIELITAPFFEERMSFIESRLSTGHKQETLCKYAQYQLHLIKFLGLNEFRTVTDEEIISSAKDYLNYIDPSRHKKLGTKHTETFFVGIAKEWLSEVGMYKKPKSKSKSDIRIESYINDLKYRGYSLSTIKCTSRALKTFYCLIGKEDSEEPINLSDVDRYIEIFTSNHRNRKTISTFFSKTRAYLRFASEYGWCHPKLDIAIVMPRIYDHETLPSFMQWDVVQSILNKAKQANGRSGLRNYAILIILASYGLRSSEVANLKIGDIDWRKEIIHIRRSKNGKSQTLPLLHSVGEAIIAYLKNGRPNHVHNESLFITAYAPLRPLTSGAIGDIVRIILDTEGVEVRHKGPHSFRHSHATYLINNGQTLKEVGDLLGHRSQESTRIYAKVDFESLKEVSEIYFDCVL